MLTSLELENFKGIAARQRIDFAPLTLLFGANSAGKSTILQALLYLHELLEHRSANVDRTEIGGNVLEHGFATTTNPRAVTTWNRLGRNERDSVQREFDSAKRPPRHRFKV